jgi:hypothetical protein
MGTRRFFSQGYNDRAVKVVTQLLPVARLRMRGATLPLNMFLYLTKHHTVKTYLGTGGIAPRILDLGTRRCVVSFTSRPLYRRGKSPHYPLNRRLGGPQSRSGRGGEEKNYQPPPEIESHKPSWMAWCVINLWRSVIWVCLSISGHLRLWKDLQCPWF